MNVWMTIVAVGAVTYLCRISMLLVAARRELPRPVELAAQIAVPVSFAALAASSLTDHVGTAMVPVAPVAAFTAAVIAVRRTGSSRAALVVGMPVLWLLAPHFGA
jgi:branched-subunit amino acid transport protein